MSTSFKCDSPAVCPDCGCTTCYDCHRGAYPRWRCKACGCDFSVTSGTLFAWRKLPLKMYLLAIVLFCNEVKGKSMLALSRDLGVQYKTAFVLAHKLREAMASSLRGLTIGGEERSLRSTAPISAAMSAPKTWRPIGLIAGSPKTSLESAKSSS